MSQPCCFAHHSVTAESMPPERRMIARSMERTVFMRRDARRAAPGRRLPTHKYLSQTRPTGGGEYLMRPGAGAGGTDAKGPRVRPRFPRSVRDRKSTRLNSSHTVISYAVFCLKKKNKTTIVMFDEYIGM